MQAARAHTCCQERNLSGSWHNARGVFGFFEARFECRKAVCCEWGRVCLPRSGLGHCQHVATWCLPVTLDSGFVLTIATLFGRTRQPGDVLCGKCK